MLATIQSVDSSLMLFLQDHVRCDFLDPVMKTLSAIGVAGAVWIAICFVLFFTKKHRKTCFVVLLTMGLCFVLNDLTIKNLICRPRPTEEIAALSAILEVPKSWSFPSGHACSCFACCYVLTKSFRRGGWFYVLGTLIAFSRCYAGLHYVSDVLAGAIIGTVGAAVLFPLLSRLYEKSSRKKRR